MSTKIFVLYVSQGMEPGDHRHSAKAEVTNGALIGPQFGDAAADGYCRELLQELYPGRKVVQVNIDPIAAGGGGIHCGTKQLPRAASATKPNRNLD